MASGGKQLGDLQSPKLRRYDHYRSDSIASNDASITTSRQLRGQGSYGLQSESHKSTISIAVDPVALITTECITVTSAMRKHTRWAQSSVSAILGGGASSASNGREANRSPRHRDKTLLPPHQQSHSSRLGNGTEGDDDTLASRWGLRGKRGKSMQDNPLISAFARLRQDLRGCRG